MKEFKFVLTPENVLVGGAYAAAIVGIIGGFFGKMEFETNSIVFGIFLLALAILERVRNPKLPEIHFTAVNLGSLEEEEKPAEPEATK